MQNITDLRNELIANFDAIKNGEIELKVGNELNNTAGKIINSLKVELAYAALNGVKPNIPFLGDITRLRSLKETINIISNVDDK